MNPKVSVLIPSYNHAKYLGVCLESVLNQTMENLEVVLVDDCSTDGSVDVARSVSDPRLRVIVNDKNLGTYGTQNRALAEAKGEYVAILNSDDFWSSTKLQEQVDLMKVLPECGFSYTLGHQVDDLGNPLPDDQHLDWPRGAKQDLLPWLLSSNRLLASSVMFPRGAVRFDDSLRFSGDWVAWLKLADKRPVACLEEPATYWRQHPTNSYRRSTLVTVEEIRVRRAILAERKHWLASRDEKGQIRKGLSNCAMDLTALYILTGNMRLAKTSAALAMRLAPTSSTAQKRMALSFMPGVVARQKLWQTARVELPKDALSNLQPIKLVG